MEGDLYHPLRVSNKYTITKVYKVIEIIEKKNWS